MVLESRCLTSNNTVFLPLINCLTLGGLLSPHISQWQGCGVLQSMGLQRGGHDLATEPQPVSHCLHLWNGITVLCSSCVVVRIKLACSVTKSCLTPCEPMSCSMPGFPVLHHLLEFAQVHVHCISDAIQPSHPLTPSSPSALSLSQHQGLFQWVSCSHQMTKILELQLQHQSFQWLFRVDLP